MADQPQARTFWQAVRHAFAMPKDGPLSRQDSLLLDRLADKVVERGLAAPAVLLLEGARPLTFVGSQMAVFFKPLVSLAVPAEHCDRAIQLLARRDVAEVMVRAIQEREARRQQGQRTP
jgi:hypothetical protein